MTDRRSFRVAVEELRQVDLEGGHRAGQADAGPHRGVDLPDGTDGLAVDDDGGRPPGGEPGGVARLERPVGQRQRLGHGLESADDVVAVDRPAGLVGEPPHRAGQHDGQVLAFVGQGLAGRRGQEDVADLEQADVGKAMAGVERRRFEEAGQHRRAQQRFLGPERVLQLDALGGEAGGGQVGGRHEGERVGLGQAGAEEGVAHRAPPELDRREAAGGLLRAGQGAGDVVVAVVAGDLLDEVDLALAVRPVGGDGVVDGAVGAVAGGEAQRLEVAPDGGRCRGRCRAPR